MNHKPRFVFDVSLSDECNFRCKYCFEKGYFAPTKLKDPERLIAEIDKTIKSDLFKSHFSEARITFWGGEPTLNIDTIKLITEKFKSNPGINFFMYTNGSHLPEMHDYLNDLCNKDRSKFTVQISYDGNPVNDLYRLNVKGETTTVRTREVIDQCISGNYDLCLKQTIPIEYLDQMHLCYDEILALKKKYPQALSNQMYFPTIDICQSFGKKYDLEKSKIALRHSLLQIAKREIDFYLDHGYFFFKWFEDNCRYLCTAGNDMLSIDTDLDVYSCHGNLYIDDKETFKISSLFADNWFADFLAHREKLNNYLKQHKDPICEGCKATFCIRCNAYKSVHSNKTTFEEKWFDYHSQPELCEIFNVVGEVKRGLNQILRR